jgi:hypothetical protein
MATLPYIQQRFHPRLKIGYTALAVIGKRTVPVHCRQGEIDGACGTYCAVMALTILSKINNPSILVERRSGVAARLWHLARESYFDGIKAKSLADLLESIGADIQIAVDARSRRSVLMFSKEQLSLSRLVILSWRTRKYTLHHWVLVVGIEGLQRGRTFIPTTFLCLDPGAEYPILCGYNGRLELDESESGAGRYYCTDDTDAVSVTLTGAVSLAG